jgi:hypothetical protein
VPVQAITVANDAGFGQPALAKIENAIVTQSLQLRAAWGTPCVQFAAGGWTVTLVGGTLAPGCMQDPCGGYHTVSQGTPSAVVTTGQAFSELFSHEILETLADPYGTRGINGRLTEVCDPVENSFGYQLAGVTVADFVLPSWYQAGSAGPWDRLGLLADAGASLPAGV